MRKEDPTMYELIKKSIKYIKLEIFTNYFNSYLTKT